MKWLRMKNKSIFYGLQKNTEEAHRKILFVAWILIVEQEKIILGKF